MLYNDFCLCIISSTYTFFIMNKTTRLISAVLLLIAGGWLYSSFVSNGQAGAPLVATPAVTVQAQVPAFTASGINEAGEEISFSAADLKDNWTLLFFYPADGTTVCPTELKALHAAKDQFTDLGVNVVPISMDSNEKHIAWGPELADDFAYTWLSDESGELSTLFNVITHSNDLNRKISMRGAFLIDPDGVLQMSVVNNENVGRNIDELLRSTEAVQSGGLCDATWQPGDDYLDAEKDAVPIPEEA